MTGSVEPGGPTAVDARRPSTPGGPAMLAVVAIAVVLAAGIVVSRWAVSDPSRTGGHPYVNLYDPPRDKAEALIVVGDGQAYAALAQDPTLARPEVFEPNVSQVSHRAEAAYRAERPLFGWLAWIGSLGRPAAVPVVLMVWTVVGAAVLAAATAAVARSVGRRPDLAFVVVMVPGSLIMLAWTGPEALAAGLALAGVVAWPRSRPLAVVAFTVAALGRESLLLVPAALAAWELRPRRPERARPGQVAPLVVAPAVWAAWVVVVRLRLGEWPSGAGSARLAVPFTGLAHGLARWGWAEVLVAVVGVALGGVAAVRMTGVWRVVLLAHLRFAVVLGTEVWAVWQGFSRVLLPVYALGVVSLLPVAERAPSRVTIGATVG